MSPINLQIYGYIYIYIYVYIYNYNIYIYIERLQRPSHKATSEVLKTRLETSPTTNLARRPGRPGRPGKGSGFGDGLGGPREDSSVGRTNCFGVCTCLYWIDLKLDGIRKQLNTWGPLLVEELL